MRDSNKSAPRNRGHRLTHLVRRLCAKNTGGGTTYIAAPSPLTEPVCLRPTPDGCTLTVRVHPGARRNAVTGFHDGALKIALTSPPVDGRANEALIAFLTAALKLPKNNIALVTGATSRTKLLRITGRTSAEVQTALRADLEP